MKIIYSSMLPLLAAVCVWTSGCGSLEVRCGIFHNNRDYCYRNDNGNDRNYCCGNHYNICNRNHYDVCNRNYYSFRNRNCYRNCCNTNNRSCGRCCDNRSVRLHCRHVYMDGDPDTASLVMDGEGGVAAYYATGNLEYSGYLECTDATSGTYAIYQDSGEYVTDFTFDDADTFHINSNWGPVTFRRT